MEERTWNSTDTFPNVSATMVTYQNFIIGSVFLTTSIMGTFGNLLVIFAVFASKKLRTVTNAFVVNLSVADLITSLLLPFNVKVLFSSEEIPLPELLCGAVAGLIFTCTACSVYNLAIIGINRLLLIKQHKLYNIIYSNAKMILWIVSPWVIGFLATVLPPLLGVGELGINQKHRVCGGVSSHELLHRQELIQSVVGFPIPLGTITFCYFAIYLHLRRHTIKMIRNSSSFSLQSSSTASSHGSGSLGGWRSTLRRGSMLARKRQVMITKNMFYTVIAFVVCITPYSLCLTFPALRETELLLYAGALICTNSAVNPVLYGIKHPHFREVFLRLLSGRWSRVPEPSDTFKTILKGCSCTRRKE